MWFPILSDYIREVIETYNLAELDFAGLKGYTVAKRSIFLLDRNGIIRYTWIAQDPTIEPNYKVIEETLEKID